MRDDKGKAVKEAGPSVPVEIMGLAEVPSAGDDFAAVEDEKLARELVEKRKFDAKEEQFKLYKKVSLDNLFSQIEEGSMKSCFAVTVKAVKRGSKGRSNSRCGRCRNRKRRYACKGIGRYHSRL